MKLQTCLKYAQEIASQMKLNGNIIYTPGCSWEFFKVKSIYLFGSVAKGKINPGDVDIMVDGEVIGKHFNIHKKGTFKIDKDYNRKHNVIRAKPCLEEALRFVKSKRKNVSVNYTPYIGFDPANKIQLYPVNELTNEKIEELLLIKENYIPNQRY